MPSDCFQPGKNGSAYYGPRHWQIVIQTIDTCLGIYELHFVDKVRTTADEQMRLSFVLKSEDGLHARYALRKLPNADQLEHRFLHEVTLEDVAARHLLPAQNSSPIAWLDDAADCEPRRRRVE